MIHKLGEKEYCISSNQVWLPGVYESERAAKYAFRFNEDELDLLQWEATLYHNATITFEMLQMLDKVNKNDGL